MSVCLFVCAFLCSCLLACKAEAPRVIRFMQVNTLILRNECDDELEQHNGYVDYLHQRRLIPGVSWELI